MSYTVRASLRCLLLPLCLLWLTACTHTTSWFGRDWSGRYEFGDGRLQLLPSGEFNYEGSSCFLGGSDAGLPNEFAGRYRVEGRWIHLEPRNGRPIEGCGVGLRLYALRVDGQGYLMDDRYLRNLVNEIRNGRTHDAFPAWHLTGAPLTFTAAWSDWLPSPYAQWVKQPAPSGIVTAIGPVVTQTRYGSGGRIEGEEHAAALTLDFGAREGAFDGMLVCLPGGSGRMTLQQVGEHQATLRWVWIANGGKAPETGMKVTGYCPQAYAP